MDHVAEDHCEGEGAGGTTSIFYKVNGKLKRSIATIIICTCTVAAPVAAV